METINKNPEQIARDKIDKMLTEAGWVVQDKNRVNLAANLGVAVREYQTDMGPADYVLFVERIKAEKGKAGKGKKKRELA